MRKTFLSLLALLLACMMVLASCNGAGKNGDENADEPTAAPQETEATPPTTDQVPKEEILAPLSYYAMDNGNYVVTITLSDDVKPVIGTEGEDAGDAFTVDADGVTIAIANYKPGLYYGIRSATELGALKTVQAVGVNVVEGKISADKLDGNSAFYQLDVDAKPFPESSNAQ